MKFLGIVTLLFSLNAFSDTTTVYEGLKHPKERDPAKQGKCTLKVVRDSDENITELEANIQDPKASNPRDYMSADWKSSYKREKVEVTRTNSEKKEISAIKITADISESIFDRVFEVKGLETNKVKIKIQSVYGLLEDIFPWPFINDCSGLTRKN